MAPFEFCRKTVVKMVQLRKNLACYNVMGVLIAQIRLSLFVIGIWILFARARMKPTRMKFFYLSKSRKFPKYGFRTLITVRYHLKSINRSDMCKNSISKQELINEYLILSRKYSIQTTINVSFDMIISEFRFWTSELILVLHIHSSSIFISSDSAMFEAIFLSPKKERLVYCKTLSTIATSEDKLIKPGKTKFCYLVCREEKRRDLILTKG
ncbi:hypothetical protein BpHYR1_016782 [Brachionus plicatilis]|uniref:Uncharacterized protein n=1 Tax=Brachionus plicatilis TaxID=10195 RepID=A0A3M7PNR2_BRAPC|nr:hypothetical protein BpHYR1_016782 [Brachionus plicatilis]